MLQTKKRKKVRLPDLNPKEDETRLSPFNDPIFTSRKENSALPEKSVEFSKLMKRHGVYSESNPPAKADLSSYLPSIDEDDFMSDSDEFVPTQKSVKAYIRDQIRKNLNERITVIVKTADETKTTDDTFADDEELSGLSLLANSYYAFRMLIIHEEHATPDMKFKPYVTSGGVTWQSDLDDINATPAASQVTAGAADDRMCNITGVIATSTSGCLFSLQWAQNTSDANDSTVKAGSYILLHKLD